MTAHSRPKFSQLRLDGVTRRFAGQAALSGLDLSVERGEFIALLGPSGCGKSTALNCLAGLLPLSAGSIWQDDMRLDTLAPEKRGFGMVFQSYALFPHMSVRRNISFGLQMQQLPRAEVKRRTEEAVRLVHLQEHVNKLPGQLSGGQQQRVAIARAVVLEPSLVLMDEPLSNLDAQLRLEMRTEIRRLHQSLGLTTIYVTHDQEEALSMADRLVVLRQGRVQQIGTPEELHTRPANQHVADFLGFRNLLPMRVKTVSDAGTVVEGFGFTLVGQPIGALSEGSAVVAGVRPEHLTLTTADAAEAAEARPPIRAVVEVVQYQGRELAVEVVTDSGVRLHVRSQSRPAPGDAVGVDVDPKHLLLFPVDSADQAGRTDDGAGEDLASGATVTGTFATAAPN